MNKLYDPGAKPQRNPERIKPKPPRRPGLRQVLVQPRRSWFVVRGK